MATMDVKDVIGDSLAKIIEAATGKKRHAELAEAVNKLVASLQTGAFVVSSSDLDKKQPDERSERSAGGGGLPDDRVAELLVPIRLALSSRSPKIIDATLASVQKLIAHGLCAATRICRRRQIRKICERRPRFRSRSRTKVLRRSPRRSPRPRERRRPRRLR